MITDLGVLEPDPATCELTPHRSCIPGVSPERGDARPPAGPLAVAADLGATAPPTAEELEVLRDAGRTAPERSAMTIERYDRCRFAADGRRSAMRGYRRDHLQVDPPLDCPAYRSHRLRAPEQPLI